MRHDKRPWWIIPEPALNSDSLVSQQRLQYLGLGALSIDALAAGALVIKRLRSSKAE